MSTPLKERINTRASIYLSPGTYAYAPESAYLYKSTGHRRIPGGERDSEKSRKPLWVGNDPFWTFLQREDPGVGEYQSPLFHDGSSVFQPGVPTGFHEWRPCLMRYFSKQFIWQDLSTFDLPPPAAPYSDFALYESFLNFLGSEYVKLLRPGKPFANLGEFLAELRDIPRLPVLRLESKKYFNLLGSEYLNVEFGWKPFVKDLEKLIKAQVALDARLTRLIDNNGIPIRRKTAKVQSDDTTVVSEGTHQQLGFGQIIDCPDLDGFYIEGPPVSPMTPISISYKYERREGYAKGFCGTFLYYVPYIGNPDWVAQAIVKLLGGPITPQTVYHVTPWTWLLDWFVNIGTVVDNLGANAVGNEVLYNASVQYQDWVLDTLTVVISWDAYSSDGISYPSGSDTLIWKQELRNKTRKEASPFGFGVDPGAFTVRQWAILAALGLSHQRRL